MRLVYARSIRMRGGACEVHSADEFDNEANEFRPFLDFAYEEICGARRIRLYVGLDPSMETYRFEYAFVNPLKATIDIPNRSPDGASRKQVIKSLFQHAIKRRPLQYLSLSYLPVDDADIVSVFDIAELRTIDLKGTYVTEKAIERLREAIPDIEVNK